MRKAGTIVSLSAFLIHGSVLAADKERRVYAPTGQWVMEYADNACRLIRNFTDGEDQITLALQRVQIGPATSLGFAGDALRIGSKTSVARFRYLPDGKPRESQFLIGQLKDGRESLFIIDASLISIEKWRAIEKKAQGASSLAELDREDEATAARTTGIVLSTGVKDEIEVNLGPMLAPVKAMQACIQDLVKSWGVDPQAMATMTRPPEPRNTFATWLSSADYPADMLRARQWGLVRLQLIVSPEGKVEDCHFDVEVPGAFEMAACQGVKKRAEFKPALDARGEPMRAYWRLEARFFP